MTLELKLLAIVMVATIAGMILFVVFGQITVRKLRKNPETKHRLGVEFASGWDILNVAQALSLPRSWTRILDRGPASFMCANSEILYRHTTKFDRWLARIFYWWFIGSGLSLIALVIFDAL